MNIVLFGPPGSGKGTQARVICEVMGIPHISTGEILRREVAQATEIGLQVKTIMDQGEFPSDDLILKILMTRLSEEDCQQGYLLDGVPRTLNQAESLDQMLVQEPTRQIQAVIALDVQEDVLKKRLTGRFTCSACGESYNTFFKPLTKEEVCDRCGSSSFTKRADDTAEAVETRLAVFYKKTAPVMQYYEKQDKLYHIDGMQPIETVEKQIESIIKNTNQL